ncbi:MAG: substrate-binding domain-containing protein, partial [Candidatus Saliniplasma sp.]
MKMQKKSKMMVFGLVGILLVASVLMAGCTEEDDGVNEVTATGSSTVLPIAETAAEEFNNEHDDIQVSVSGGGSGYGINAIIEGTADIGMASRDIKQSE